MREVVVVGHRGVLGMELTGACDIFALANTVVAEAGRPPAYRVTVASMGGARWRCGAASIWPGQPTWPVCAGPSTPSWSSAGPAPTKRPRTTLRKLGESAELVTTPICSGSTRESRSAPASAP
jgi:hypothetical protein